MSKPSISDRVNQAMGTVKADLVIKNVDLLNVATGTVRKTDIAITGNTITGTYQTYEGAQEINGEGLTAVPGFIDAHVHVESSQITPLEFDRCVLPQGTTTAICDPHEISNVLGVDGLDYFVRASEATKMDLLVALSSCVPATGLETSGAVLEVEDLLPYKDHTNVVGLAEFMNIGGVLGLDPNVVAKLEAWEDGHIDGHMPGIQGAIVNAMASCGICNCHESITLDEAHEKIEKGLQVFVREGSVTKNAKEIGKVLDVRTSPWVGLCTDDRNPAEIAKEGHIDHVIRQVLSTGADMASVYRAASWSTAQGFGLHKDTPKWQKRGLIAPGFKADIVLLNDPETCSIAHVIKDGQLVTEETFKLRPDVAPVGYNSVKLGEVSAEDFVIKADANKDEYDVIGVIADQIVTDHLKMAVPINDQGEIVADPTQDLLKLAVLERHGKNGNVGKCLIKGFGFKDGAIAASVGHDSHNITTVGATDADIAMAVNAVRDMQGGFSVVKNGQVMATMPLPIAGLMSDKPFEDVREDLKELRAAAGKLNANMDEPFMLTAFMALCVIPELKLTDWGLVRFNPAQGDHGPVLIDDQRKPGGALTP